MAIVKNALGGAELAVLQNHMDWFYDNNERIVSYTSEDAMSFLHNPYADRDLIENITFRIQNLKMLKDFDGFPTRFKVISKQVENRQPDSLHVVPPRVTILDKNAHEGKEETLADGIYSQSVDDSYEQFGGQV
jgi:hypothetical protein